MSEKQLTQNPFQFPVPTQGAVKNIGMLHSQSTAMRSRKSCLGYEVMMYDNECAAPLFSATDVKNSESLNDTHLTFGITFPTTTSIKLTGCIEAGKKGDTVQLQVESTEGMQAHNTYAPVPFGEQFMITSVDSETTATALRGIGSVYTGRIEAGTILIKTGNLWAEGDVRPLVGSVSSGTFSIHTQIVKNGWAMTGTAKAMLVAKYGNDINMSSSYERMLVEHAEDIDAVMIHGQMASFTRGGLPMQSTAGMRDYIMLAAPQNVISIATALNYDDMNAILEQFGLLKLKGVGSVNKIIYADRVFTSAFSKLGRAYSDFSFEQGSDIFGKRYKAILTDNYQFTVYHHCQLDTMEANELGNASGIGLIVDLTTIEIRYLKGRRQLYKEFGFTKDGRDMMQTDSASADIGGGVVLSEFLVVCKNPAANGILVGFNQAVCVPRCPSQIQLPNAPSGQSTPIPAPAPCADDL